MVVDICFEDGEGDASNRVKSHAGRSIVFSITDVMMQRQGLSAHECRPLPPGSTRTKRNSILEMLRQVSLVILFLMLVPVISVIAAYLHDNRHDELRDE